MDSLIHFANLWKQHFSTLHKLSLTWKISKEKKWWKCQEWRDFIFLLFKMSSVICNQCKETTSHTIMIYSMFIDTDRSNHRVRRTSLGEFFKCQKCLVLQFSLPKNAGEISTESYTNSASPCTNQYNLQPIWPQLCINISHDQMPTTEKNVPLTTKEKAINIFHSFHI